ncbi:hypothetical protein ACFVZH_20765 [Streptomyces sp. NPDC059534]|uniref:hypothetical protein n=1 Tax=Streptomyces sp. NPDC059534 TaxID=3346859 RepID=UPI0036A29EC0
MNEPYAFPRCTSCRRRLYSEEIAAGRYACVICESRTFEALRAIPTLFDQINGLNGLIKGGSQAVRSSGGREAPAPLRVPVLSDISDGGVVTELQAIADAWFVALAFDPSRKLRYDEIGLAVHPLINNLRWACEEYPEIAADIKTITDIHGRLGNYTTGERGPRKFTVYCSTDDCAGEMRVSLASSGSTCPDCETDYHKRELMQLESEFDADRKRRAAA